MRACFTFPDSATGSYKSHDGGKTWSLKNNGITQSEPFAWRLARAQNGTLYVLIARRSEDGSIGNAGDGALYQFDRRRGTLDACRSPRREQRSQRHGD